MKRSGLILLVLFILMSCEKEKVPGLEITHGSFTDSRDSRIYSTVIIGDQEWMAENLAFLPFVNKAENGSDVDQYCYVYDHDSNVIDEAKTTTNYKLFGVLYNWPAAVEACPVGWHLPGRDEWEVLFDNLESNGFSSRGGNENIGKSLCSQSGWAESRISGSIGYIPNENNLSGFSALPAGHLPYDGVFSDIEHGAYFWSSTSSSEYSPTAYSWNFLYTSRKPDREFSTKISAFSVRCIRD